MKKSTKALTLAAVLIAAAFVLNNFAPKIKMPYGGSATLFSMFILFFISYTLGPKYGILACVAYGLLDLTAASSIYYPLQAIVDYPIAFGLLGVGGILRNKKYGLYTGYLLSVFLRFLATFASGAIFFGEYAPEGFSGVSWSFVYNISYIGIEAAVTLVVLLIPQVHNALYKLAKNYGL